MDPVDDCTFWYTQEYYSTTCDVRLEDTYRLVQIPGMYVGGRDDRAHPDG